MTEEENVYKAKIPLLTDQEIRDIDNCRNEIIDKFTKMFIHDKDLAIAQHIIKKQQEKIKMQEDNYEELSADISDIAKELGLEEDATIDEIYTEIRILKSKRVNMFEQLDCIERKDKIIDLMAKQMSAICTGILTIRKQFEKSYCEFINTDEDCCWKINQKCSDCIKQYFQKKVEDK